MKVDSLKKKKNGGFLRAIPLLIPIWGGGVGLLRVARPGKQLPERGPIQTTSLCLCFPDPRWNSMGRKGTIFGRQLTLKGSLPQKKTDKREATQWVSGV